MTKVIVLRFAQDPWSNMYAIVENRRQSYQTEHGPVITHRCQHPKDATRYSCSAAAKQQLSLMNEATPVEVVEVWI